MYLFHLARVRPSGSNRFNAQWQRSLSTAGPALRQSAIKDQARSSEREKERTTTYVLHTRLRLDTLQSDPRAHCLPFRRQTARDVRTEKEREIERVSESALDGEKGMREKTGRTYIRIGGYISSGERIRLEIIGRYTRIHVGRRSRRVYQDLTSGDSHRRGAGKAEKDVRK